MNRVIRGEATDVESLREMFVRKAGAVPVRNTRSINVPGEVYDRYWDVYKLSVRMANMLERVLDDNEHALIMDEAAQLGYRLPDFEVFREEIRDYREALREFRPVERAQLGPKGYVKIPAETARMFNNLMAYNCFMVSRVFDGCFNTEYMRHFKNYKDSGHPYSGPTALQETLDTLLAMVKTNIAENRQISRGRQRPDWPSLVAA